MKDYISRRKLQSPGLNDKVQHILSTTIENDLDVKNVISDLNTMLINAACVNVPKRCRRKKKCKNKSKPWYDTDLKTLKRDMILLSKQVVKDFRNEFLRSKLYKLKKLYKRTTIRKKNYYKQNILNNLEDLEDTNPKEYWALFNKLKSDKCSGKNKNNVPEKNG